MDEERIAEIFERVYDLTFKNKLGWAATDPKKNEAFYCKIGEYNIYVLGLGLNYTFLVRRSENNVELGRLQTKIFNTNDTDEKMERLFKRVKRSVLKIDEGLDDLLNKLDKI